MHAQRSCFCKSFFPRVLVPFVFALAACSSGGDGGGGGGGGTDDPRIDLGVTDAAIDQLAAFSATVGEVRLIRDDSTETSNLLAAPVEVEFIGLNGLFGWLASDSVAAGTYDGARVSFVSGSASAIAQDGTPVAVQADSDELVVTFASPLVLQDGGYQSILVDLDLLESLQGDVSTPPLVFTPQGSVSNDDGSGSSFIDEVKGIVQSVAPAAGTINVNAFVDDDAVIELGPVVVQVRSDTLILSDNGGTLTSDELFALVVPSQTMLEIHGVLTGGEISADRIEIEDLVGGGDDDLPVKIEGIVLSHELDVGFELLILEIEKGQDIAGPVLQSLGNPASIDVVYDPSTLFFADDDSGGGLSSPDAITAGQRIKVKFALFLAEPFTAARVELEDAHPDVDGFIVDLTGLPVELVMHVEPDEPVIPDQVASSNTDVIVDLEGASLFLDTENEPPLTTDDLLIAMAVEVEGPISGPNTAPTIDATKVKVRAGRIDDAVVTSIDRATSSFTTEGGELKDPFGSGVGSGPLAVTFDPQAVVEDEAGSIDGFFDLFESLEAGESLVVEIEGIGTGAENTVIAFEVEAKIED